MNVSYPLHGIIFEWDRPKADANIRKHGIAFELACEAFFDPFVYYVGDDTVNGELRETIIGFTRDRQLLYVVYVMRENLIRVISARLVTRTERVAYENQ